MHINLFRKQGKSVEAFYLTLVRLLSTLLTLVSIKIVSVHFSLDEFGTYSQAILIVSTLTSMTILGMTDAVNYFYNNKPENVDGSQKEFISTLFFLQLVIGVLAGFLVLCTQSFLTDYFHNPSLYGVYIWIAFQPLLANLLPMIQVLYISIGRVKVIVIRNLIIAVLRFAIFAYSVYATGSIITILALTFVCDLIQVSYFVIDLHRNGIRLFDTNSFRFVLASPILKYSIPMAVFIVLNALLRDVDKWIIGYFGTTDELGIYANCSRVLPFDMLMSSFSTILIPVITTRIANEKAWVAKIFSTYLNLGVVTTLILVGSSIICAKDLLLTLYDEKYVSGLYVFIVYLLVDIVRFANISLIYSSTGKSAQLLSIAIQTLVINVVVAIGLYYWIGILGPALATLFTMIYANLRYLIGAGRILETSLFKYLNWQIFFKIMVVLVTLKVVYLLISHTLDDFDTTLRLIITIGMCLIVLSLLFKGVVLDYIRTINSIR